MLLFFQVRALRPPAGLARASLRAAPLRRGGGSQNSVAVLCCMLAKKLFPRIVKYSRFNMDVAIDWLPVNLLFIAMLMTGFFSLKALAVPMVTIFKNLTNVAILAGDWSAPRSLFPGHLSTTNTYAAAPLTRRA